MPKNSMVGERPNEPIPSKMEISQVYILFERSLSVIFSQLATIKFIVLVEPEKVGAVCLTECEKYDGVRNVTNRIRNHPFLGCIRVVSPTSSS
jgi:hypothetical protein